MTLLHGILRMPIGMPNKRNIGEDNEHSKFNESTKNRSKAS